MLYERWSARAMSGESLSREELMRLFEAARWAPSSFNEQPWRFVYAKRNTPQWRPFLELLDDFNQKWARHAAALVIVASRNSFEKSGKPSRTHSFDTGAAWQNLALQGRAMNLVVHAMAGFDYRAAARCVDLTDEFQVEAMIAVGRPAEREVLEKEMQEEEVPTKRRSIHELAFEGQLPRAPQTTGSA